MNWSIDGCRSMREREMYIGYRKESEDRLRDERLKNVTKEFGR